MILHLGVIDQPYARKGGTTTGQVAEWLENRYHVMEVFAHLNESRIERAVAESYAGSLESGQMGGPNGADPLAAASAEIEEMFRLFIDTKQMEFLGIGGQYPVPTKAALRGVDHRKKHPYKRRPPRPSFRDTSLYESSFRVWGDDANA